MLYVLRKETLEQLSLHSQVVRSSGTQSDHDEGRLTRPKSASLGERNRFVHRVQSSRVDDVDSSVYRHPEPGKARGATGDSGYVLSVTV